MTDPIELMPELLILREMVDEANEESGHMTPEEVKQMYAHINRVLSEVQNDAYERAAIVADGFCTDRTDLVAKGIRALKEEKE